MAVNNKSLGKVARSVKAAIETGMVRALNKALATTKTKTSRQLRDATGLKTKSLDKRLLALKASKKKPIASINVATKVGVQLSEFSPKEKKIILGTKGGKKKAHYGVTVKIGNQPRQLVPGAFLRAVKSGKALVFVRTQSYKDGQYVNPKAPRYGITTPRINVLRVEAERIQVENSKFMKSEVDRLVDREVEFALSQLINK